MDLTFQQARDRARDWARDTLRTLPGDDPLEPYPYGYDLGDRWQMALDARPWVVDADRGAALFDAPHVHVVKANGVVLEVPWEQAVLENPSAPEVGDRPQHLQ